MYITRATYLLIYRSIHIDKLKITRETERCYFTDYGKFLKSELNAPHFRGNKSAPALEIAMVDGTEEELKKGLISWFTRETSRIHQADVNICIK